MGTSGLVAKAGSRYKQELQLSCSVCKHERSMANNVNASAISKEFLNRQTATYAMTITIEITGIFSWSIWFWRINKFCLQLQKHINKHIIQIYKLLFQKLSQMFSLKMFVNVFPTLPVPWKYRLHSKQHALASSNIATWSPVPQVKIPVKNQKPSMTVQYIYFPYAYYG